jgi:hypothetical protein
MASDKKSGVASSTMTQRKYGNYAKLATKTAVSTGLGFVPVAGNVFNVAMAVKSARSSHEHAKKIKKIRDNMVNEGRHDELGELATTADYAVNQKTTKRNKAGFDAVASAVPVAGSVAKGAKTVGYKAKGLYKMITGTRGVERKKNAGVLIDTARGGDRDAKMILLELFDGSFNEYLACLQGDRGAAIEMVSGKLASG